MSKVVRLEDAETRKALGGTLKVMFGAADTKNLRFSVGYFGPKEGLNAHIHPESEEVYYVIKGKGHLRVGKEEFDLSEGMGVVVPSGQEHFLKNNGKETMHIAFITSPPEKWWLLERLERLEEQVRKLTSKNTTAKQ